MRQNDGAAQRFHLDVEAAYNRDEMEVPEWTLPRHPRIQDLIGHPKLVARMAEQDCESVLLDLYVARRCWMQ